MTQRQPRHLSSRLGITAGPGGLSARMWQTRTQTSDSWGVPGPGGSIFFSGFDDDHVHVLLVLDEASGDFSTITLPLALDGLVDDRENL